MKLETLFPVFVSELHVFNHEGDEAVELESTRVLLERLSADRVGWAMWTW